MSFLGRILCLIGIHARSRRKAHKTEGGWHSVCRHCGLPLVRVRGGDWRPLLNAPKPSRAERVRQREVEARRRRVPPPRRRRPEER